MKEFGERLKKYREHKDLSQTVFGKKVNTDQGGVSHWENGRNMPDAPTTILMVKSFPDLNIVWLFTGEGEMILKKEEGLLMSDSAALEKVKHLQEVIKLKDEIIQELRNKK